MVFQTFADDSGSEPQSKFFVLGGFIADHDQWATFSDEWAAALGEPPGLDYFKMKEAASLTEQFSREKGWDEAKRDDRLITLARIIRQRARVRVSAIMPFAAFQKHIASLPASQRSLGTDHPYSLLALQIILAVAVRGDLHGIDSPCDFIFDQQLGFSEDFLRMWPTTKALVERAQRSDIASRVGSPPIFRDEKEFLPLQAADLYAWQVRNHHTRNSGTILMPPSRVLGVLEPIPEIFRPYDEAELIRLREHLLKIREIFVQQFPDIPLIPLSDDPAQRKRQRRLTRKKATPLPPASVSDEKPS